MMTPQFRDIALPLFAVPRGNFYEVCAANDFIRWAFPLFKAGANAVYCSVSLQTVKRIADEGVLGQNRVLSRTKTFGHGGRLKIPPNVDAVIPFLSLSGADYV